MSLGKQVCRNCMYEDISKRINSSHPDYPGIRHENGYAIWCKLKQRYIADNDRQGVRKKSDNTYEENIWCTSFVHY